MTRVLHIVPDSVLSPEHKFLGSTKDIFCRTEYFESRRLEFETLYVKSRSDQNLLWQLMDIDCRQFSSIFIEFARYRQSLKYIRKNFPNLPVFTRPATAEFLHQIHMMKAFWQSGATEYSGDSRLKTQLRRLRQALRGLKQDGFFARRTHCVAAICDWEKNYYWKWLAMGTSRVETVPYFLPDRYLPGLPQHGPKSNLCVCLTTSLTNHPFMPDMLSKFFRALRGVDLRGSWRFSVTGSPPPEVQIPTDIEVVGWLDDPIAYLSSCRAVAVLSDLGFGFKTKIMDAVLQGCWVLVAPSLHKRLPSALQSACLVVDPNLKGSMQRALDQCLISLPPTDINELLRQEAFQRMDEFIV